MSKKKSKLPHFPVLVGTCLGYEAFRGFAPLSELAKISDADIFDQDENRMGTQRNLSLQHARKAYQYVSETERAFYPEMILNVRDRSYVNFTPLKRQGKVRFGTIKFTKNPKGAGKIIVSRLD